MYERVNDVLDEIEANRNICHIRHGDYYQLLAYTALKLGDRLYLLPIDQLWST